MPKNSETEVLEHARKVLETHRNSVLHTLTNYGRGETDYVRIFAPRDGEIVELTYYVAVIMNSRIVSKRGIPLNGGQYNKGLEIAQAARTAIGASLDQSNDWREL